MGTPQSSAHFPRSFFLLASNRPYKIPNWITGGVWSDPMGSPLLPLDVRLLWQVCCSWIISPNYSTQRGAFLDWSNLRCDTSFGYTVGWFEQILTKVDLLKCLFDNVFASHVTRRHFLAEPYREGIEVERPVTPTPPHRSRRYYRNGLFGSAHLRTGYACMKFVSRDAYDRTDFC